MKYLLLFFLSSSLLFSSSRLEMMQGIAEQVQEKLRVEQSEEYFEILIGQNFDFSDKQEIDQKRTRINKELNQLNFEATQPQNQERKEHIKNIFLSYFVLDYLLSFFLHVYSLPQKDLKNIDTFISPITLQQTFKLTFGNELETEINNFITTNIKDGVKSYIADEPNITSQKLNDLLNTAMHYILNSSISSYLKVNTKRL
jgi:hypothetical protein